MPQNRITLRQHPAPEFHNGYIPQRIQLRDLALFVGRVLLERVADVVVGDAGVLAQETDDLAAAAAGEVEVVDCGDAADGIVGGAGGAAAGGGGHCGSVCEWCVCGEG